MTTFKQFSAGAKMRHDFSDQIQVRYSHSNGESFDTWVSGEEVMSRLDSRAREQLIRSFSQKNWTQMRDEASKLLDKAKQELHQDLRDRLADEVTDGLGDNVFSDTLADNLRGEDSNLDEHDREKRLWRNRLQDSAFRTKVLELAWTNLEGTLPDEGEAALDDWV